MDDPNEVISNGRARSLANLLPPFQRGQTGNPGGKPKGKTLRSALREALKGKTIWGQEIPIGLTALEAVAQSWVREAIKGSSSHLQQIRDCLGEEARAQIDEAMRGVVFEIIANNRDSPAPELGNNGEDGKDGEQGEIDASNVPDKQAE